MDGSSFCVFEIEQDAVSFKSFMTSMPNTLTIFFIMEKEAVH